MKVNSPASMNFVVQQLHYVNQISESQNTFGRCSSKNYQVLVLMRIDGGTDEKNRWANYVRNSYLLDTQPGHGFSCKK